MADVTELLNQDHREVEVLFAQFEETGDYDIAMQICEELLIHATVEEEIVYPPLKKADAEIEQEAEKEHKEAEMLIDQIQALEPGDQQLRHLVTKLKEAVEHHVEEEESEAWPKLREEFADKLEDLGDAVEQRKQELRADLTGEGETATAGSGSSATVDLTKEELMQKARDADIQGRSKMTKEELAEALDRTS